MSWEKKEKTATITSQPLGARVLRRLLLIIVTTAATIGRASKTCQTSWKVSHRRATGNRILKSANGTRQQRISAFCPWQAAYSGQFERSESYSLGISSVVPALRRWVLPMPFILRILSAEAP